MSEWNDFVEGLSPAHQFLAEIYQLLGPKSSREYIGGIDDVVTANDIFVVIRQIGSKQLRCAIADELGIR